MGKVLSVNIIWIIKNDRPNRPLSWPSLCFPSDAAEMLIAVNQESWEDWGTGAAVNPDPRCWSQIDNNLEITTEFQLARRPWQGQLPKRDTFLLPVCFFVFLSLFLFLTSCLFTSVDPLAECTQITALIYWIPMNGFRILCHLHWFLVFFFSFFFFIIFFFVHLLTLLYYHRKLLAHHLPWIPSLQHSEDLLSVSSVL